MPALSDSRRRTALLDGVEDRKIPVDQVATLKPESFE
jgi:hypothetical protein